LNGHAIFEKSTGFQGGFLAMTPRIALYAFLASLVGTCCNSAFGQYYPQQPAQQYSQPAGPQQPAYPPAQRPMQPSPQPQAAYQGQPQGAYQGAPGEPVPPGAAALVPQNVPTLERRTPQPVYAPFQLTPAEQAEVDSVLKRWEEASRKHKRIAIEFFRLEFRPDHKADGPLFIDQGEADFTAEGKWLWHVEGEYKDGKVVKGQREEKMLFDGRSIYVFEYDNKKVNQQIIAADMKGEDMIRAMLPFMFGTDVKVLKERYLIRLLKFPGLPEGQVCIDAWPRYLDEAKNYKNARMIVDLTKMEPTGLMLILPNGKDSYRYQFTKVDVNPRNPLPARDPFDFKLPQGWEVYVEQMPSGEVSNRPAAGPVR